MIFITFDPSPISTAPQVLALYRVEAYVRELPIVGDPGEWSLADAQPANIEPRRLRIPAGESRYQIAVRFVRTSDESVESAYEDTEAPENWPAESVQVVTCAADLEEGDVPSISAGAWRRVSPTNTRIPLTISDHEPTLRTVIQWKRVGKENPWTTAVTLDAGVTAHDFDIASSGGTPDGTGTMGNLLQFRCYQLSGEDEEGPSSAVAEAYAGVEPPAGVAVTDDTTSWGVSWSAKDAQAGAAPATMPVMRVTPLGITGTAGIATPTDFPVTQSSGSITKLGLSPQRFLFQHLVSWTDPSWPNDFSATAIVAGYPATAQDSLPVPAFNDPMTVALFNGLNVQVISTIGAANNATMELEVRRVSISTGNSEGFVFHSSQAIASLAQVLSFFVENAPGQMLQAVRARQRTLVDGSPVFSEWITATLPGFDPILDE